HADEAARGVEQRTAGVARVDRRVGLHEREVDLTDVREVASDRGHYPERDGRFETERIADRYCLLPWFEVRGVPELDGRHAVRQLFRVRQPQEGEVVDAAGAHHFDFKCGSVREGNFHGRAFADVDAVFFEGTGDDVEVRDDVPVFIDQEAAAGRL